MKPNYKKGLNFADLKLLGVTAMTNAGHKAQWGYNSSEDFLFCFQNCSDLFVRKKCSGDWEDILKLEAEGWEFAKCLRLVDKSICTADA